jgi:nucleoside phosphorylase
MIAITFALPTESADLRRQLRDVREESDLILGKIDPPSPRLLRAGNHQRVGTREELRSHDIAIVHTGVGAKNCNERVEALLHKARPRLVVSSGFAGAVAERLEVGDLIVAENFSEPQLLASAGKILHHRKPRVVKLFTSTSIVDSIAERNEIARKSGAAAVDMETGAIVGVCSAHGVPLLSLRAISDTPSEPLPAPPDVLFDLERQRTNYGWLFSYILREPASALRLLRFGQTIAGVRAALTDALVALIREL